MRTRNLSKLSGNDAETEFHRTTENRIHDELQIFDSTTVKVEHTTRGIKLHVRIPPVQKQEATGGMQFRGEWDAEEQYAVQDVVIYPTGAQSAAYVVVEAPPVGTAPDTGAPYFVAWPYPPPGVWA